MLNVAPLSQPKLQAVPALTHEVDQRNDEKRVLRDAAQFRDNFGLAGAHRLADRDPSLAVPRRTANVLYGL
jgi:hypothetical protein